MTTDITYCSEYSRERCLLETKCKRANDAVSVSIFYPSSKPISISDFEPHKGENCYGFMPKAPLTIKPLEDK